MFIITTWDINAAAWSRHLNHILHYFLELIPYWRFIAESEHRIHNQGIFQIQFIKLWT